MIHSPSQNVLSKNTISGLVTAAAIHGYAVDRTGFTRAMLEAVANPTGAGTTVTFSFEDSPDNAKQRSDCAHCAGARARVSM